MRNTVLCRTIIKVFVIVYLSMLFIMIPNIINNHGLFLYAGDYFFQQIPFYKHAVDVLHSNGVGWDWYTDLGNDFITSYSYYLTGSVFFWMISWLSSNLIVYAMPLMLAFKTAIGAVGAYLYIGRYVRDTNAIFIGAYMYAFSGYQMASLVFNSFHDITALFPFLLFSFDLLVVENEKIFFAFMVALVALTNYFFFVAITIFVIIYYIIKCLKKDFKFTFKSFITIFFESLIGLGISAIILLPTFLVLSSANRLDETLYGIDLISYSDNTIIPKILQSLFIMPDTLSNGMLFKSSNNANNWASISLYLPVFTIAGVVAYMLKNKHDWISITLKTCFIIALVPGLNSVFSLFNASYYARWYFMPVLIMCMASSKALDEEIDLKAGIKISVIGIIILCIIACLPDMVIVEDDVKLSAALNSDYVPEKELRFFTMSKNPIVFWQCIAFSGIFLLIVFVYDHEKKKAKNALKRITVAMIPLVVITNTIYLNNTVMELDFDRSDEVGYKLMTENAPDFDDDSAYRITIVNGEGYNNLSMIWRRMNATCFHSVEANEIDDYYINTHGVERGTLGLINESDYGQFSVKYILNISTGDDLNVEYKPAELKGCTLYDKQGMYYIYKNDHYVPFGVTYEYCIDEDVLEKFLEENIDSDNKYKYKNLVMMRALILDKEEIEKYKAYITEIPESMLENLNSETYFSDCDERRAHACSSFEYDSNGYRAEITVDKPQLVYFSVPCSDGWSAKINGSDVEIIKAHYGLTAVPVEPGENKIVFSYHTPGLKEGKTITFISLVVFVLYSIMNIFLIRNKKDGDIMSSSAN